MYRKYIRAVEALEDYILLIDFTSGSRLLLDMKPHLDTIRFCALKRPAVWNSAETNGVFVRFGPVELRSWSQWPSRARTLFREGARAAHAAAAPCARCAGARAETKHRISRADRHLKQEAL